MRSKKLLNKLKNLAEQDMIFIFSDEKNFDREQKSTEGMTDCYVLTPLKIHESRIQFTLALMVFGAVINEKQCVAPFFFQRGLGVNSATYFDFLGTFVKSRIYIVRNGMPYIFLTRLCKII